MTFTRIPFRMLNIRKNENVKFRKKNYITISSGCGGTTSSEKNKIEEKDSDMCWNFEFAHFCVIPSPTFLALSTSLTPYGTSQHTHTHTLACNIFMLVSNSAFGHNFMPQNAKKKETEEVKEFFFGSSTDSRREKINGHYFGQMRLSSRVCSGTFVVCSSN